MLKIRQVKNNKSPPQEAAGKHQPNEDFSTQREERQPSLALSTRIEVLKHSSLSRMMFQVVVPTRRLYCLWKRSHLLTVLCVRSLSVCLYVCGKRSGLWKMPIFSPNLINCRSEASRHELRRMQLRRGRCVL